MSGKTRFLVVLLVVAAIGYFLVSGGSEPVEVNIEE